MRVILTNDESFGNVDPSAVIKLTKQQIINYLHLNEQNAVVLVKATKSTAVFRGASYQKNNFYICDLPTDDPGDADGGMWTAQQAVAEAQN